MEKIIIKIFLYIFGFIFILTGHAESKDPLPSWNEGQVKSSIIQFVKSAVDKNSQHYLSPGKRFATFDQDGTLWVEQPIYTQVIFALDRVIELAPQHPEWKTTPPFQYVIAHNRQAISKFTAKDFEKIVFATHTGTSVDQLRTAINNWLAKAKNPRWNRPYTELVYQPMLELLNYLRANGFETYIVTGGGQEFVRAYSERVYGIPPQKIIGSTLKTKYMFDKTRKQGMLVEDATVSLYNNFSGKPEDIYLFIGRKPNAAFGNSTGDQQMLEYTEDSRGENLMLLVHHDDAKREYSYGPESKVGTFSDALMAQAKNNGWLVVSMKNDWKRIFPFEK